MATHSSVLARRIQSKRSLGGCCPQGHKESDTTEVTYLEVKLNQFRTILRQNAWAQPQAYMWSSEISLFLLNLQIQIIPVIYNIYKYKCEKFEDKIIIPPLIPNISFALVWPFRICLYAYLPLFIVAIKVPTGLFFFFMWFMFNVFIEFVTILCLLSLFWFFGHEVCMES